MADQNAPKPPDAKRDGVTTNAQSGTSTGASGGSPSGGSGASMGAAATKISSPSQPAGTAPGTGDAGSERNLRQVESKNTSEKQFGKVTDERTDEETGVITRFFESKDGVVTTVSAVNQEELDKHAGKLTGSPGFENQTQSLLGTPGNVNLTQDGTLAGDKSVRDGRKLEEIHEEIEAKAGPNPLPNREGNEFTKASNYMATAMGTQMLPKIDRDTSAMSRELKELAKKDSLSADDKDRLETISKQLDTTARI